MSGEPDGIGGSVEFRTDVFNASSIEVLVERLGRVLSALTEDPSRRLSSVDVLDEVEHARLDAVGQPGGADRAGGCRRCRFRGCSRRRSRAFRMRWRCRVGVGR